MELDQLKNQWRKEMELTQQNSGLAFTDVKEKVSRFNKAVFYRDCSEIAAALLVAFFVTYRLLTTAQVGWLTYFGNGITIGACLFIVFMLLKSKRVTLNGDWTLASRIDIEITSLESQKKLLQSVASWYIAPIMLGVVLSSLGSYYDKTGSYIPDMGLWIYFGSCLALSIFIYWLNRRAANKKIEPVLTAVKNLRKQLNEQ